MQSSSTQTWVEDDLATLDLGDKRRNARAVQFVESCVRYPGGTIPQVSENHAEAKANYRLLSNEAVDPDAIRRSLQDAAVRRIGDEDEVILVPQDTTALDLRGLLAAQNLGPIGTGGDGRGIHVHSALLVADGVPLGLAHQQCWARSADDVGKKHRRKQLPIEEKESYRWIQTFRAVQDAVPEDKVLIQMGDRESDIFLLFAEPRRRNSHLLLRAYQNRRVEGNEQLLWDTLDQMPVALEFDQMVHPSPHITVRKAHLELRYGPVTVLPPKNGVHNEQLQPVTLNALEVREVDAPASADPILWRLVTDLPIDSAQTARRYVEYYEKRWLIERYHYVLKSGCNIEDTQLRAFDRIERLLALLSVVALRLLWLTYSARVNGDAPCTLGFSDTEWQVLYRYTKGKEPPPDPPTLREAVRWLGMLGGFLARKGDGEPGVKVLWRGILALHFMIAGFLLANPTCG